MLDLVEEFRQPVVDRTVIAAISRGMALETREGMLTDPARKAVAAAVLERMEGEVTFQGRRHQLKSVIQIQARARRRFRARRRPLPDLSFQMVSGSRGSPRMKRDERTGAAHVRGL